MALLDLRALMRASWAAEDHTFAASLPRDAIRGYRPGHHIKEFAPVPSPVA